jgi:hypothetical protein
MAVVPIREVLEAFFWSGVLSVGVFTSLSLTDLIYSMGTLSRFSAFSFHPNLLAFLLAGYFCVMVWKFRTSDRGLKILAGLAGLICLVIIFFASSRGSLVGLIVGCGFMAGMTAFLARRQRRIGHLRLGYLTAALLIGIALFIQYFELVRVSYAYVAQVLDFSSDYRGIRTGLTGRVDNWKATLSVFDDGTWLVGRGIRSSDSMGWRMIDNSYLVILYEMGLLPVLLITWRYLSISRGFFRGYFLAVSETQRHFYLACGQLMVVFLVNNIVARYLFAVGNPYSLLAVFLFAAPTSQIFLEFRPRKAGALAVRAKETP